MSDWTDEELEASVVAYRDMQRRIAESKAFTKKDVYRELSAKFDRTDKAFEFRMQNISSVLNEQGLNWVKGLPPAGNVGAYVKPKIEKLLAKHPIFVPTKTGKIPAQAAYKEKLPAMRSWLIAVARRGEKVTYGQVRLAFPMDRFSLAYALSIIGNDCVNRGEPILSAFVVSKATGECGPGFENEFDVDERKERKRLTEYWRGHGIEKPVEPPTATFEQRASRFVSVEARPDQAAFRRRVFEACGGKCVVTGCDIVQTLDAAHKTGRNWRDGHNEAKDGFVMRKDVHALYDAGLLDISNEGILLVGSGATHLYGDLHGKCVTISGKGGSDNG